MSDNTGTEVAARTAKPAELVRAALERMKPQLAMALPKHLTADRLLRVAMTAVQTTPALLDCDRTSLYQAVMTCAQLGLEPDGVLGQAYLVPFKGRVTFIPGYKGLISLARNSGEVATIIAREVCENDTFEYNQGSGEPPYHPFEFRADRGKIIGFYAVAKFKDGSFQCEPMTLAEIEAIRNNSQGYKAAIAAAKKYGREPNSPWVNNFVEMAKKTCIRRLAKYLPMSVQKAAALADAYDTGKHVTLDKYGELLIEGEAQEREDVPAVEGTVSKLDQFEARHGAAELDSEEPPECEPEPRQEAPIETGGHDNWRDNFDALRPLKDLSGGEDWTQYADAAGWMISKASRDDLAGFEPSQHPTLKALRAERDDLYRSVTAAVAERAKELAGGRNKAA